jgi:hypothetical protein
MMAIEERIGSEMGWEWLGELGRGQDVLENNTNGEG